MLDEFFGTKEVGHMTYNVGQTNWPRQPEHLRHILDVFQQEAGFEPIGALKQTWVSGAKAWHSVFGESVTLLRLSVEYMRQKELMIASPRSCITVAAELQRKGEGLSKQDYFRDLAKKLDAAADLEVDEED